MNIVRIHYFSGVLIVILLGISCLSVYGQSIELYGGLSNNRFHDYRQNEGRYSSSYEPGNGYSIGIAVDSIKADVMSLRLTLKFDKYAGSLKASGGGQGGGHTTEAQIEKSLISLGVFPVNLQILKRIDFNFGFEIARLVSESYVGTRSGWAMNQPAWSYELEEMYEEYSSYMSFGISARLAYNLRIDETFSLSPQYSFYFGLVNEFGRFPEATKSMRHFLGLGIKKKLR